MHLLYTNYVPILTYACGIKEYPSREMKNCNTALNNGIRKIFSYNRWESIRALREFFSYKSLIELFAESRKKFLTLLPMHHNHSIRFLSHLNLFTEGWLVKTCDFSFLMFCVICAWFIVCLCHINMLTNKRYSYEGLSVHWSLCPLVRQSVSPLVRRFVRQAFIKWGLRQ